MAIMCLINIPVIILLSEVAIDSLRDYEEQKRAGQNPVFKAQKSDSTNRSWNTGNRKI